jgi:anhydro-N-acetylmuramic acid kinase
MSGTSTDGLSIINVKIEGVDLQTRFEIIGGITVPYDQELRSRLIGLSTNLPKPIEEISSIHWNLGKAIWSQVKQLDFDFDVIVYSGHTVYHGPSLNMKENGTFQIGEISITAAKSGKTAISDFRITDMANGGFGAPLIALSDYIIFKKPGILTINIGGISNITYISERGVLAFDTGPGNMLIDQAMEIFYNRRMDENGTVASSGNVSHEMLSYLMEDPFLKTKPPKNSGREYYGPDFLKKVLGRFSGINKMDIVRTLTRYTSECIKNQIERFVNDPVTSIIVGGGGTKNKIIMKDLNELFQKKVSTFTDHGIPDEYREALGFAIIANQTLHNRAGNIWSGIDFSGSIIGKITPGTNYPAILKKINCE